MPRFAILAHDHPVPHWDLFLESGPALRSWRLLSQLSPGVPVAAEPGHDHRLLYLDYEGPVSGGRGTVRRIDAGPFDWVDDTADQVCVQIRGARFVGRLSIQRTADGHACAFESA
jgi:hypothetical protein